MIYTDQTVRYYLFIASNPLATQVSDNCSMYTVEMLAIHHAIKYIKNYRRPYNYVISIEEAELIMKQKRSETKNNNSSK